MWSTFIQRFHEDPAARSRILAIAFWSISAFAALFMIVTAVYSRAPLPLSSIPTIDDPAVLEDHLARTRGKPGAPPDDVAAWRDAAPEDRIGDALKAVASPDHGARRPDAASEDDVTRPRAVAPPDDVPERADAGKDDPAGPGLLKVEPPRYTVRERPQPAPDRHVPGPPGVNAVAPEGDVPQRPDAPDDDATGPQVNAGAPTGDVPEHPHTPDEGPRGGPPSDEPPARAVDPADRLACVDAESWTCFGGKPPAGARAVVGLWVPNADRNVSALARSWGLPDTAFHPSAGVVLGVRGLADWIDAREQGCEESLRLVINGEPLDLRPTVCEPAAGRVLFQLSNLSLASVRETNRDGERAGWTRLLQTRSHTFWTDVAVTVQWGEERLPTAVTPGNGAAMWLVPPVNAWLGFIGILCTTMLIAGLGLATSLLRDGPGKNRPFSLSRVQGAWWFACVFASWEILNAFQRDLAPLGGQALSILAISGGTYTVAQAKRWVGEGAKGATKGFWLDLISDGEGPAMQRLQYVVWSVAVGVAYVYSTIVSLDLPKLDDSVLWLMGMSAGGYVVMKPQERSEKVPDDAPLAEEAPAAPPG